MFVDVVSVTSFRFAVPGWETRWVAVKIVKFHSACISIVRALQIVDRCCLN